MAAVDDNLIDCTHYVMSALIARWVVCFMCLSGCCATTVLF